MTSTLQRFTGVAASLALLLAATAADAQTRKQTKPAAAPPAKAAPKAAPAPSAAKHGVGEGDTELGFFANYTTFDDIDNDTLLLGAVFGKFLTDSLELRVTPVITYTDSEAGGEQTNFFSFLPYVTVEYLFRNNSPVVPYVGGGIGLNLGFGSSSGAGGDTDIYNIGLFVTPVAGVKFFVSERMALEYALGLQVGFVEQCIDSTGVSDCFSGDTETISNTLRFNVYY